MNVSNEAGKVNDEMKRGKEGEVLPPLLLGEPHKNQSNFSANFDHIHLDSFTTGRHWCYRAGLVSANRSLTSRTNCPVIMQSPAIFGVPQNVFISSVVGCTGRWCC